MSRHWGFDLAFGSTIAAHWDAMVFNRLEFAIFRAGEGAYTTDPIRYQAAAAINAHVPFGAYWAIHPWTPAAIQVQTFLSATAGISAKCLVLDFELYVAGMTPAQVNAVYHEAYDRLRQTTTLPVVIYSGWWFIEAWCPPMLEWIDEDVYWEANYRQYFNPATWDEFDHQLADLRMPVYAGYPVIGIHQYAGSLPTPMVPHRIDYNYIDDDQVYAYLFQDGPRPSYLDAGIPPTPPPSDMVMYRVSNPTGTYLQSGPSWSAGMLRYLRNGYEVLIDTGYTQVPGWLLVMGGGYVAAIRVTKA